MLLYCSDIHDINFPFETFSLKKWDFTSLSLERAEMRGLFAQLFTASLSSCTVMHFPLIIGATYARISLTNGTSLTESAIATYSALVVKVVTQR